MSSSVRKPGKEGVNWNLKLPCPPVGGGWGAFNNRLGALELDTPSECSTRTSRKQWWTLCFSL
jgi:hypothetical protein